MTRKDDESHSMTREDRFLRFLRDSIPPDNKKWVYSVDLFQSSYKIENTTIHTATLTGKGQDICATVRLTVGRSKHTQIIEEKFTSLEDALSFLFELPAKARVCRECGRIPYETPVDQDICGGCVFLSVYAERQGIHQTCTICSEPAYRLCLPCGHVFHTVCILNLTTPRCPNCRQNFSEELVDYLFGNEEEEDDTEGDDENANLIFIETSSS